MSASTDNICIMRGEQGGIPYWHIVKVPPLKKILLNKPPASFNASEYGEILESGWGSVIPTHLLEKYNIPAEAFYEQLHSEEYKEKAYYEFSLCKQLQVTGYPAVLLQATDQKFYLLARGFTDYETLHQRVENVLADIQKNNTPA